MSEKKKLILIGAGGHAKVIIDSIDKEEYEIVGLLDKDSSAIGESINGIKIIGTDADAQSFIQDRTVHAIIAIGNMGNFHIREELYKRISELGYKFTNVIHKTSIISKSVRLGTGNVIMPGCIINSGAVIKDNSIINTGAIIEHDVEIGDNVHIAPGVVISGGTKIGNNTLIGVGSTIIQGIKIGNNCIIGAGSTVIKDINDNSLAVGTPAKVIREGI